MATMEESKAILHFGNGARSAWAIDKTMPSPGRVSRLALTVRKTPSAVRKQPARFQAKQVK